MIFIIGGAFQGKTEFAKQLSDGNVFVCEGDFPKSEAIVTHIERYALEAVKNGKDPVKQWQAEVERFTNSIIIADDVSSGVVPMEPEIRAWREATGRVNSYLAGQADQVYRVFCGLGQRLK